MTLKERIEAFSALGSILSNYTFYNKEEEKGNDVERFLDEACTKAMLENAWFTPGNLNLAISSIGRMLRKAVLEEWSGHYSFPSDEKLMTVAVIMAGNIPLVGFHDFLCVLLSGNKFSGKMSSGDHSLLPAITALLIKTEPRFEERITLTREKAGSFDAVIATGSNNSAGYFNYYFSRYPHIIRKNRNAIAIITGQESPEELSGLAGDIFTYFGLGCRNVSKIYIPEEYDLNKFLEPFSAFSHMIHHHKYNNNYTYQKTILQLNSLPYNDNGFLILREEKAVSSPVAVVNYEYYKSFSSLLNELLLMDDQIQCVVCREEVPLRWCRPGEAQHPSPADYADGVDTMKFLLSL